MPARRRLDHELVRRGLVASRSEAQLAIETGQVTVGGAPVDRAARLVAPGEPVELAGPPRRFVSRGGDKLEAALDQFGLDPTGWRVVDAGASTGGFTDCVLQRGACEVVALDVGHGQLHERLRADERVELRQRTNVRDLSPGELDPADLVMADLSFISLVTVLDALMGAARPGGHLVLLVKPQFEAGRSEADRGRGVITDPGVWRSALERVIGALADRGASIMDVMASPLKGTSGNVEFLVHAVAPSASASPTGPASTGPASADELVRAALDQAAAL